MQQLPFPVSVSRLDSRIRSGKKFRQWFLVTHPCLWEIPNICCAYLRIFFRFKDILFAWHWHKLSISFQGLIVKRRTSCQLFTLFTGQCFWENFLWSKNFSIDHYLFDHINHAHKNTGMIFSAFMHRYQYTCNPCLVLIWAFFVHIEHIVYTL